MSEIRPEFGVERHGRRFVLLAGVLDLAHARGLEAIETELLQVPDERNGHLAIVKATVRLAGGRVFTAHGDASPQNVNRGMEAMVVRLAEARAIARALRLATNIAVATLEEAEEETPAGRPTGSRPTPVVRPPAPARPSPPGR